MSKAPYVAMLVCTYFDVSNGTGDHLTVNKTQIKVLNTD